MSSLLLLNGSPRGPHSNSMRMLDHIASGWKGAGGEAPTVLHLARGADFAQAVAEFAEADTVLLGMPLYTDCMPGLVAEFFEALEPRVGRDDNPRLAFLVQSGFMEATHSRGLERYLVKLARRLGAPYAGTIVRGNGEALQAMPDEALRKLFARLGTLGEQLARDGAFGSEALREVAGVERFSAPMAAVASVALMLPVAQMYWNSQLKKNGAWDRRFNTPYGKPAR